MKPLSRYAVRFLALMCGIALLGGLYADDEDPDAIYGVFRKNISKSPALASNKAKMNIMPVYMPFVDAQGEPAIKDPDDPDDEDVQGKPIVVTYVDESEEVAGVFDTFGAISRDDGASFKRKNLSRTADDSSFQLENGFDYPGDSAKPLLMVAGNRIMVAWSDKYCRGGSPLYSISPAADKYGVAGSQRSIDYDEDNPELGLGEIPFSCVWTARGVVLGDDDFGSKKEPGPYYGTDYVVGDIVWYKPERLTSGRRDAYQLFLTGKANVGFALTWQEDPEGLRPGYGDGPGTGFSGATTNHKTDIWYSFVKWNDFLTIEEEVDDVDDPDEDLTKPRAAVRMSAPVRISDNDICTLDHADLDDDDGNAHAYCANLCDEYVHIVSNGGQEQDVCVASGDRLLDGDTGASRPNLFMQGKWAILAYEETKGVGLGNSDSHDGEENLELLTAEETDPEDIGKDIIYHTFDFAKPPAVSGGDMLNLPELDPATLEPILIEGDTLQVRDRDDPDRVVREIDTGRFATENARRVRFILQGASGIGDARVPLIAIYKQGIYGKGRPSDVMLRRLVLPEGATGNPYAFTYFADGAYNMSAVTPIDVEEKVYTDEYDDKIRYDKVNSWKWDSAGGKGGNLNDQSWMAPMTDARAHRGQIRGDFVVLGFTFTPNWAASRNGNDKYDFYIRTSYDGGLTWETTGETWTQKPHEIPGVDVLNATEPRNISLLKNNKFSVVEPRIVATPGTIWMDPVKQKVQNKEDLQDKSVFFWSYGLEHNWKKTDYPLGVPDPLPTDMFYSQSKDKGRTYNDVLYYQPLATFTLDDPDVDRGGYGWNWLANRKDVAESEAQLRMTPAGTTFYSIYLSESGPTVPEDDHFYGSDIWLRKIEAK